MQTIKMELSIREQEIGNYIEFCKLIEEGQILNGASVRNVDFLTIKTSMKANIIIMLYNIVESIMTKCIKQIHQSIKREELCYDELSADIQRMLLVYYEYAIQKSKDPHRTAELQRQKIELIRGHVPFSISYEELSKYYSLYSGNLDSKQITAVLTKYGIYLDSKTSELQTIKKLRNSLAHGEESFEEIGRNLSLQQAKVLYDKTFRHMENVLKAVEEFLNEKRYKLA